LRSPLQPPVLSFGAAIVPCLLKSVYFETDSSRSHLTRSSEKLPYGSMNSAGDDRPRTLLAGSPSCSCGSSFFPSPPLLFFGFCLVIGFGVSDVHAGLVINITTGARLCHGSFVSDSISKAASLLQARLCLRSSAVLPALQCSHPSTAHARPSRVPELMCRLPCRKSLSRGDCSDRPRKRLLDFVSPMILKYKQI